MEEFDTSGTRFAVHYRQFRVKKGPGKGRWFRRRISYIWVNI